MLQVHEIINALEHLSAQSGSRADVVQVLLAMLLPEDVLDGLLCTSRHSLQFAIPQQC
jgi:hypothetical protein